MRRRNGELTIRERALAARNARVPVNNRNARLAAQSAARERQVLRSGAGAIPLPASNQYSDDMKDNEIGPKRPKFIDPSDIRVPDVSSSIQWQDPNNRVPLTAMQYHNEIVRRRNANISRVLEDIRNVQIPIGMEVRGGRRGLFVNNLDRNIDQAYNMRVYRFTGEDEKQN
jgi:hypothetical protein